MKKLFAILTCISLIAVAVLGVSAENGIVISAGNPELVYHAAYGTAVVDGVKDDIYDTSDTMIASYSNKDDATSYAEYWMVFNKTTLFIYCHVTDVTRNPGAAFATSVDCVDMVVDLNYDFTPGVTDANIAYTSVISGAQFRVNPAMTATDNIQSNAAKSWGSLHADNCLFGTLQLAVAYDNDTDGSYSFEIAFNFTADYADVLAANLKDGKNTAFGFGLLVNESKESGSRYAMIVSNNCGYTTLSKSCANLGKVELDALNYNPALEPVETTEPAPETTAAPDTTAAPETTAATPETTAATPVDTSKDADTTSSAPEATTQEADVTTDATSSKGGCGSSLTASAVALCVLCLGGAGVVCFKKKN